MLIDTHTHLYVDQFDEDRADVIQRAMELGVRYFLLPNIDSSSVARMEDLVNRHPENCFPMYGLHPGNVGADYEEQLTQIKSKLMLAKNCVAIGEIGMDLYWDKTYINEQKSAFRTQIQWAKELCLPIVIHARDAFKEIFDILDEENDEQLKGVFHCFTGSKDDAERILNYGGFKFGIGGVLTYKNSGLSDILSEIPLDKIILETDSPYLPPTPHRGKRNESSFLIHVADKLAEVYGMSRNEIDARTSKNAIELFQLTVQSTNDTTK
jgi:TatD DNase family protein